MINEDEFRELMQLMGVIQKKDDLTYLLNIVDSYRHQQMTYSEIVSHLS